MNKLKGMEIEFVHQVLDINPEKFSEQKGIGKKAVNYLIELQNWLRENEDSIDQFDSKVNLKSDKINIDESVYEVEINHIEPLISSKLINKFKKFNIHSLLDLTRFTLEEFKKLPTIGSGTILELKKFLEDVDTYPDKYIQLYKRSKYGTTIPIFEKSTEYNVLNVNRCFIDQYLNIERLYGDPRIVDFNDLYYGLNGQKKLFRSEISILYELTQERIRQLQNDFSKRFKKVIEGQKDVRLNVTGEKQSMSLIFLNLELLQEKLFFNVNNLNSILNQNTSINHVDLNYWVLSMDVFKLKFVPSAISSFTEDKFVFNTKKIDAQKIMKYAKFIIKLLNNHALPMSFEDVVIATSKKFKSLDKKYVKLILDEFSDIDRVGNEESRSHYQLKFDKLTRVGLMGYRVLFERNRPSAIDDILSEVQRRLFLLGVRKQYERMTLQHSMLELDQIVPRGRMGIYSLKAWNENSDSISDLITSVLLEASHPLKPKQITRRIQKIRPNITEKSIRTIISMDFFVLKNGKCILPNWKTTYQSKIKSKSDLSTSDIAINIMKTHGNKMIKADLLNILSSMEEFDRSLAHSTINRKYLFQDIVENDIKYIIYTPRVKSKKESFNDKFLLLARNFFIERKVKSCKLIELVEFLESKDYKRSTIYKLISRNDTVFRKYINNHQVFVGLLEFIDFALETDWDKTKIEIILDLEEVFNDPRQKKYTTALDEIIVMMKSVIDFQTNDNDLNGLSESLLPTMYNFYTQANNKSDLLVILKDLTISLDAFARKILIIVNPVAYNDVVTNKYGLGKVIDKLSKIDPRKNRFKSRRGAASLFEFGEHIWLAYNSRNQSAHTAPKMSLHKINESIRSTMVVYAYMISEYYFELNNQK